MGRIAGEAVGVEGKHEAEIEELVERVTARLEGRG
jgi:hypothetical protein